MLYSKSVVSAYEHLMIDSYTSSISSFKPFYSNIVTCEMDDFERALLIAFNFSGSVDISMKDQANTYIAEVKKSPECLALCVSRFSSSPYSEVKFWCLQTLHEILQTSYLALSDALKTSAKGALMTWVQRDCNISNPALAPFLRNKIAQCVVCIIQYEFPSQWPNFFQELIGALQQGEGLVDMFCRILIALDEDIISLDIPRSQEGSRLSMTIKDGMREHALPAIAEAWWQLLSALHASNPGLTAALLGAMGRYISWIDINLVANEKCMALLVSLTGPSEAIAVRVGALDCLTEVVAKRMEPGPKLALLDGTRLVPLCASMAAALAGSGRQRSGAGAGWANGSSGSGGGWANGSSGDSQDDDLMLRHVRLLATVATEIMDSLKRLENGIISLTAMGLSVVEDAHLEVCAAVRLGEAHLSALFPALMAGLTSSIDEVAMPLMPFMSAYIARLKVLQKRNQGLSPEAISHVRTIMEGVAVTAQYPDPSVTPAGRTTNPAEAAAIRDEQNEVDEKRRDLFILFKNAARLSFAEALQLVRAALTRIAQQPSTPWQEVEVAVALLYELGEAAPDDSLKAETGGLWCAVRELSSSSLPDARHRRVAAVVLETFVRYVRVFQQQSECLPAVLSTFLDERGIGHPAEEVSTRACYLFCRLVKSLRTQLRPYLPTILTSLQPHLSRAVTMPLAIDVMSPTAAARDGSAKANPAGNTVLDDRLYMWEAVGLLLGAEEVGHEQQRDLTRRLLEPLMVQVAEGLRDRTSPTAPALIVQAMEGVARLSKGYKTELLTQTRPDIGHMFSALLDLSALAPPAFPRHTLLRARFVSLLHRLVEALAGDVLPYLGRALEGLMRCQEDCADMVDLLSLLNQLVVKYKASLQPLLEAVLPAVITRVLELLGPAWDWGGSKVLPSSAQSVVSAITSGRLLSRSNDSSNSNSQNDMSGMGSKSTAATSAGQNRSDEPGASVSEDVRERMELQRTLYSLLLGLGQHGVLGALLVLPPPLFDTIMSGITSGAAEHGDVSVRRTCMLIFSSLVEAWCGGPGSASQGESAERVPGFKRFAVEVVGGAVSVASLVRPPRGRTLDPGDAATMSLITEAASLLRRVYARCGEELLSHLASSVLPVARVSQALGTGLLAQLREADGEKGVREWLRQMVAAGAAAGS